MRVSVCVWGARERSVGYDQEEKGNASCTAGRKGCAGLGVLVVPWGQVRKQRCAALCYGSGSHSEA